MFKRRPTRSDRTGASAYSRRAAAADLAWAAQDRIRDGLGAIVAAVGWPFERVTYSFQERLAWPLEDRAATLGAPARALSFGAVILLAAAAGVGGLIWAAPDGPHRTVATEVAASAAAAPQEKPAAPTLQGAAPVFSPKSPSTELDPAKAIVKSAPAESRADTGTGPTSAGAASSSSSPRSDQVDGPPAGPEAIAVARNFADAFVLYETGETDATVREAFGETATPALGRALLQRPPRLPANVEVPKAKVLNVVPAPSHGTVYPVSVSLLRVGVTSELRLDLERQKGEGWRVTNVLG